MKPMLIALHGLPGSGKDTFANSVIAGSGWGKVAFAGPLKRGISAMFDIPMEDLENPSIKNEPNYKFGRSIRYMAQTLGTEWGRNLIADDVWLQLGRETIERHMSRGLHVVNTDLRFENEVQLIKDLGGYVIHIIRDNNSLAEKSSVTGVSAHPSDASIPLDSIDFVIHNNKTIEEFYEEIAITMYKVAIKHGEGK